MWYLTLDMFMVIFSIIGGGYFFIRFFKNKDYYSLLASVFFIVYGLKDLATILMNHYR